DSRSGGDALTGPLLIVHTEHEASPPRDAASMLRPSLRTRWSLLAIAGLALLSPPGLALLAPSAPPRPRAPRPARAGGGGGADAGPSRAGFLLDRSSRGHPRRLRLCLRQ